MTLGLKAFTSLRSSFSDFLCFCCFLHFSVSISLHRASCDLLELKTEMNTLVRETVSSRGEQFDSTGVTDIYVVSNLVPLQNAEINLHFRRVTE
jgi:hypothetical protein